jgi:hypothetical protein
MPIGPIFIRTVMVNNWTNYLSNSDTVKRKWAEICGDLDTIGKEIMGFG